MNTVSGVYTDAMMSTPMGLCAIYTTTEKNQKINPVQSSASGGRVGALIPADSSIYTDNAYVIDNLRIALGVCLQQRGIFRASFGTSRDAKMVTSNTPVQRLVFFNRARDRMEQMRKRLGIGVDEEVPGFVSVQFLHSISIRIESLNTIIARLELRGLRSLSETSLLMLKQPVSLST